MSDFISKATGGHAMSPRPTMEHINSSADSSSTVEVIDCCRYGREHMPKGYARTAGVAEAMVPEQPSPDDARFANER